MRAWTILFCGVFAMIPVVGAVAADTAKPFPACANTKVSEADRAAAQGAFTAGQASFNEADYRTAIMYWRDAFRRDCTATLLLLNLSRAYEASGDKPQAILALKTYLGRVPNTPDKAQIQRRIANLEAPPPPLGSSAPTPFVPGGTVTGTQVASAAPSTTAPAPTTSQPNAPAAANTTSQGKKGRSVQPWPWVVIGVGGTAVVTGAIVFLVGQGKINSVTNSGDCDKTSRTCTNQPALDKANSGRTFSTVGGTTFWAGLAVLAGGAVWQGFAGKRAPADKAVITPTWAPGYGGLDLQGSF